MPSIVRYAENGEVAFLDDPNPDADGRTNPMKEPVNFPEFWGRQIPVSAALSMDALTRGTVEDAADAAKEE
jgi:hypothetical protein